MTEGLKPDWFNMNLSDLVKNSMALGVIPILQFNDKGSVDSGEVETKPVGPMEQTPITVLETEIRFYQRFIHKIDNKIGFAPDTNYESLIPLKKKLVKKITEFKKAIKILTKIKK